MSSADEFASVRCYCGHLEVEHGRGGRCAQHLHCLCDQFRLAVASYPLAPDPTPSRRRGIDTTGTSPLRRSAERPTAALNLLAAVGTTPSDLRPPAAELDADPDRTPAAPPSVGLPVEVLYQGDWHSGWTVTSRPEGRDAVPDVIWARSPHGHVLEAFIGEGIEWRRSPQRWMTDVTTVRNNLRELAAENIERGGVGPFMGPRLHELLEQLLDGARVGRGLGECEVQLDELRTTIGAALRQRFGRLEPALEDFLQAPPAGEGSR